MPCSFCGHYIQWREGKRWAKRYERHYILSDRYEADIRQGRDGTYWVLWDFGDREKVYWYTPSEASGLIWFLECWRCKRERDYARKMRDLRYIATIKLWQEWSILRRQNFEEGQQLLDLVKYTFF